MRKFRWKAYIDAAKHFGIDSLMDGYCPVEFDDIYLDKPDSTSVRLCIVPMNVLSHKDT